MKLRVLAEKANQILDRSSTGAASATHGGGVFLLRRTLPTAFEATVYQPLICLILQGAKESTVGGQTVELSKGKCILVSHDLPVVARITRASERVPYLALVIRLDLSVLRALYPEVGEAVGTSSSHALKVARVDERLTALVGRYLDILDDPVDARVLGPLVQKELHYRLLRSALGDMLGALLRQDSHASRISGALVTLRESFRKPIEVKELARSVGMSTSSFHKHFKAVTGTTAVAVPKGPSSDRGSTTAARGHALGVLDRVRGGLRKSIAVQPRILAEVRCAPGGGCGEGCLVIQKVRLKKSKCLEQPKGEKAEPHRRHDALRSPHHDDGDEAAEQMR